MMAAPLFQVDDATAAIRRWGFFSVEDAEMGARVRQFSADGFPIKSPHGLEFLAQSCAGREDVSKTCESILAMPRWGLIKVYSDILPDGYVYRFHNGSTEDINTILVQLWSPDSEVVIFHGSVARTIAIDHETSRKWGLLAASERHFDLPISTSFKLGGLAFSDSRLGFAIRRGFVIFIGFATENEVKEWGKMKLPYSDQMKEVIQSLEARGTRMNYAWLA
ncbi:hypothetical protein BB8028_0010g00180 [Beauveria bassiana]|uniref:Uncharacterized protein n=1 Tax=Beauveria bassiana TaxID=176275 RepID=A0A2S7YPA0_BEABA|nr:hypothetical protein BB8028_0010g00180 [Beauveria bassiana]